jgi:hypothetical protein
VLDDGLLSFRGWCRNPCDISCYVVLNPRLDATLFDVSENMKLAPQQSGQSKVSQYSHVGLSLEGINSTNISPRPG